MKVSIVISSHNYDRFLRESIDSALAQTWGDKEVIVVDDASNDQSREILRSYGDQIQCDFVEFHSQIKTVNRCFELSKGDLVIFLDADDRLYAETAERFVNLFRHNAALPTPVKASGYLRAVDVDGEPTGRRIPRRLTKSGDHRQNLLDFGPRYFRAAYTSGNAWSREFLDQVFPLDPNLSLGPDGQLNLICPLFGRVAAIETEVADYRVHDRNKGPTAREFSRRGLERILLQNRESRQLLDLWVEKTSERPVPTRQWDLTWRELIMSESAARFGSSIRRPSLREIVRSCVFQGQTSTPKRLLVLAAAVFVKCLPDRMALAVARRMLNLRHTRLT